MQLKIHSMDIVWQKKILKFFNPKNPNTDRLHCFFEKAGSLRRSFWSPRSEYKSQSAPGFCGFLKISFQASLLIFIKKAQNPFRVWTFEFSSDPGRIRTCDLLIRSQLLYPTELRDQFGSANLYLFGILPYFFTKIMKTYNL